MIQGPKNNKDNVSSILCKASNSTTDNRVCLSRANRRFSASHIEETKDHMAANCRLGEAFQIPIESLPDAKEWEHDQPKSIIEKSYGDIVWNSKKAKASTETTLLELIVPHDRKESALKLFHENDYKLKGILHMIMQQSPKHGLDWSIEKKQTFSQSITKNGKDFYIMAQKVNKCVGDCQSYYYNCFKRSHEYSSLKQKKR